MKNDFIGYYRPTKDEKDLAWQTGVFIFDTNALLNLYRYSKATRDGFLIALEKIKERVFLPYHVALEFHKNRYRVIEDSTSKYETLIGGIEDIFKKTIENHFNQVKKHPSIDIKPLKRLSDNFISDLKKELTRQKSDHPDHHKKDEILDKITNLFSNKTGTKFTDKQLESICNEGKTRYEKKIPPGYKDSNTKSNQNEYGDLIVWKEVIAYAKQNKIPIIFVTDDQKEDWWTIEKGIAIRPREELIKEFFDETGIRVLIYNADRFLRAAKRRKLIESIDPKSLDEVLNFSKSKFYGGGDPNWIKLNDNDINKEIIQEWLKKYDIKNTYKVDSNRLNEFNLDHQVDYNQLKDFDQIKMIIKQFLKKNYNNDNEDENLVEV